MEFFLLLIAVAKGTSKGETDPFVVLFVCLLVFGFWRLLRNPESPPRPPEEIERMGKELERQTQEAMRETALAKQEAERRASLSLQASQLRESEIRRLGWMHLASLEILMSVSPLDFEGIVASLFQRHGYAVRQTPGSGDGGKDIVVERKGKTSFVECKRFGRDNLVGTPLLRSFLGAMADSGVRSGIFVTTSDFNPNAREFGKKHGITLINGTRLASALAKLPNGTDDPDRYRALCLGCGNTQFFSLSVESSHPSCACGKIIPFPLAITDLISHVASQHKVLGCPKCGSLLKTATSHRMRLLCPNMNCDFTFSLATQGK